MINTPKEMERWLCVDYGDILQYHQLPAIQRSESKAFLAARWSFIIIPLLIHWLFAWVTFSLPFGRYLNFALNLEFIRQTVRVHVRNVI